MGAVHCSNNSFHFAFVASRKSSHIALLHLAPLLARPVHFKRIVVRGRNRMVKLGLSTLVEV